MGPQKFTETRFEIRLIPHLAHMDSTDPARSNSRLYLEIAGEEKKMLVQKFGNEYTTYQKTVDQFFPKLKKAQRFA